MLVAVCFGSLRSPAADVGPGKSALETDPKGWVDIMPRADLKGWSRVPVPPKGKLGRKQWHVDANRKLLVCDGGGGHVLVWR